MEPATKIKLPVAYKTMTKIDNKLQSLNKTGSKKVLSFVGSNEVEAMFYLYLFKKYKSNCFLHDKNVKTRIMGMSIEIKENYNPDEEHQIMTQLNNLSALLVDCIRNVNSKVIIIPVQLLLQPGQGHANILIYRKHLNQIEHFEPHGSKFLGNKKMQQYNQIIERWMRTFVFKLNSKLSNLLKKSHNNIRFISSSEVCPRIEGLQTLEAWSNLTNIADLEPGGYCTAWSLFFTELCLKNPETPSSELMNYIFNTLERMDNMRKKNYLKEVIRGYSIFINEKLSKYFTVFFKSGLTIEKLKKLSPPDLSKFRLVIRHLIELEMNLSTDPSYLQHGLKIIKHKLTELNARLNINSDDDAVKKQIENFTNKKNIFELYNNFNVISNPSRSNSSKSKSKSKTVKVEKTCPEGKVLNPISGRCVKVKTTKVKTVKVKMVKEKAKTEKIKTEKIKTVKEKVEEKEIEKMKEMVKPEKVEVKENVKPEKTCPEGKVLNPISGRCVKVKTTKVKTVKVKTVKVKPVKEKEEVKVKMEPDPVKEVKPCPEGEVLKCVKVKTTKDKNEKIKPEKEKKEKNEKDKK